MSKLDVKKFYELAEKDMGLAKKLASLDQEQTLEASDLVNLKEIVSEKIIPLAKEQGFDFTADELLEYANERYMRLSDDELLDVSGGVSARAAGLGLAGVLTLSLGGVAALNMVRNGDVESTISTSAPSTTTVEDKSKVDDLGDLSEEDMNNLRELFKQNGERKSNMPSDDEDISELLKQLGSVKPRGGMNSRAGKGAKAAAQDDVDMNEIEQYLQQLGELAQKEMNQGKQRKNASVLRNRAEQAAEDFNVAAMLEGLGARIPEAETAEKPVVGAPTAAKAVNSEADAERKAAEEKAKQERKAKKAERKAAEEAAKAEAERKAKEKAAVQKLLQHPEGKDRVRKLANKMAWELVDGVGTKKARNSMKSDTAIAAALMEQINSPNVNPYILEHAATIPFNDMYTISFSPLVQDGTVAVLKNLVKPATPAAATPVDTTSAKSANSKAEAESIAEDAVNKAYKKAESMVGEYDVGDLSTDDQKKVPAWAIIDLEEEDFGVSLTTEGNDVTFSSTVSYVDAAGKTQTVTSKKTLKVGEFFKEKAEAASKAAEEKAKPERKAKEEAELKKAEEKRIAKKAKRKAREEAAAKAERKAAAEAAKAEAERKKTVYESEEAAKEAAQKAVDQAAEQLAGLKQRLARVNSFLEDEELVFKDGLEELASNNPLVAVTVQDHLFGSDVILESVAKYMGENGIEREVKVRTKTIVGDDDETARADTKAEAERKAAEEAERKKAEAERIAKEKAEVKKLLKDPAEVQKLLQYPAGVQKLLQDPLGELMVRTAADRMARRMVEGVGNEKKRNSMKSDTAIAAALMANMNSQDVAPYILQYAHPRKFNDKYIVVFGDANGAPASPLRVLVSSQIDTVTLQEQFVTPATLTATKPVAEAPNAAEPATATPAAAKPVDTTSAKPANSEADAERIAKEKAEQQSRERERIEKEKAEQERKDAERKAKEDAEAERKAKKKAEQQRRERERIAQNAVNEAYKKAENIVKTHVSKLSINSPGAVTSFAMEELKEADFGVPWTTTNNTITLYSTFSYVDAAGKTQTVKLEKTLQVGEFFKEAEQERKAKEEAAAKAEAERKNVNAAYAQAVEVVEKAIADTQLNFVDAGLLTAEVTLKTTLFEGVTVEYAGTTVTFKDGNTEKTLDFKELVEEIKKNREETQKAKQERLDRKKDEAEKVAAKDEANALLKGNDMMRMLLDKIGTQADRDKINEEGKIRTSIAQAIAELDSSEEFNQYFLQHATPVAFNPLFTLSFLDTESPIKLTKENAIEEEETTAQHDAVGVQEQPTADAKGDAETIVPEQPMEHAEGTAETIVQEQPTADAKGVEDTTTAEELQKQAQDNCDEAAKKIVDAFDTKIRTDKWKVVSPEALDDFANNIVEQFIKQGAVYNEKSGVLTFSATGTTKGKLWGTNKTTKTATLNVRELLNFQNEVTKCAEYREAFDWAINLISTKAIRDRLVTMGEDLVKNAVSVQNIKELNEVQNKIKEMEAIVETAAKLEQVQSDVNEKISALKEKKDFVARVNEIIEKANVTNEKAIKQDLAKMNALKADVEKQAELESLKTTVAEEITKLTEQKDFEARANAIVGNENATSVQAIQGDIAKMNALKAAVEKQAELESLKTTVDEAITKLTEKKDFVDRAKEIVGNENATTVQDIQGDIANMNALKVEVEAQQKLESTKLQVSEKFRQLSTLLHTRKYDDLLTSFKNIDLSKCTTVTAYEKAIAQMDVLKKQAEERYATNNQSAAVKTKHSEVQTALDSVVKDSVKTALQKRLVYIMNYSGNAKHLQWCENELDALKVGVGQINNIQEMIDTLRDETQKDGLQKQLQSILDKNTKVNDWNNSVKLQLDTLSKAVKQQQEAEDTHTNKMFSELQAKLQAFVTEQYNATTAGEDLDIATISEGFVNGLKAGLDEDGLKIGQSESDESYSLETNYHNTDNFGGDDVLMVNAYVDTMIDKLNLEQGKNTGISGAKTAVEKALSEKIRSAFKANKKANDAKLTDLVKANIGAVMADIQTNFEDAASYIRVTDDNKLEVREVKVNYDETSDSYITAPGDVIETIDLMEIANKFRGEHDVDFAGETRSWDGTVENLFKCAQAADFDVNRITNVEYFKSVLLKAVNSMKLVEMTWQIPKKGFLGTSCGTGETDYKHKAMLGALANFAFGNVEEAKKFAGKVNVTSLDQVKDAISLTDLTTLLSSLTLENICQSK